MLVEVIPHRTGYYIAVPVSQKWRRKFAVHMEKQGERRSAKAFFQSADALPEEILTHPEFRELEKGWSIRLQVDPWMFGHWLGYDAHTVADYRRN